MYYLRITSSCIRVATLLCTHKSIIVSQVCFCEEDLSRLFPIRWTDFAQVRFREERSGLLAGLKLVAARRLLREKLAKTNPSSVMIPIKRCGYTVSCKRVRYLVTFPIFLYKQTIKALVSKICASVANLARNTFTRKIAPIPTNELLNY